MRNVFDQYTQPENQLTHALACSLHEDQAMLQEFVAWLSGRDAPNGQLRIVEQTRPGVPTPSGEDNAPKHSLPDAWITCDADEDWSMLIEVKAQAPVIIEQLVDHRATAATHGFPFATLVLITAKRPPPGLSDEVKSVRWSAVYAWFRERRAASPWARRCAEYIEIIEAKWIARDYLIDGHLTMFTGIETGAEQAYTPQRAKQQLKHAMEAIRAHPRCRAIGIDPKLSGRGKIPVDPVEIWDYVNLVGTEEAAEAKCRPHFTLGIRPEGILAVLILPNHWLGTGAGRKVLRELTYAGFTEQVTIASRRIVERLGSTPQARPWILVQQRRALTGQKLNVWDAQIEFDPQTAVGLQSAHQVGNVLKVQPEWLNAVYEALTRKKANVEMCLGGRMEYGCPDAQTPEFIERVLDAWEATVPLLRALHVVT